MSFFNVVRRNYELFIPESKGLKTDIEHNNDNMRSNHCEAFVSSIFQKLHDQSVLLTLFSIQDSSANSQFLRSFINKKIAIFVASVD